MVDLDNLLAFTENAITSTQSTDITLKQAYHLPKVELVLHSNQAEFHNFCQTKMVLGEPSSDSICYDIFLGSPEDCSIDEPPIWGDYRYAPLDIDNCLKDSPYRATYFHDDHLWHLIDHKRQIGLQWMRARDAYPPWEQSAPLRIFMHWIYAQTKTMRLTHAGSLGENGCGVIFAGNGGAGKSGTVSAGVLHGLDSVGDDYILLENGVEGVVARPLFLTFKQDRKGIERLGLDAQFTENCRQNWQGKYEFSANDLSGKNLVERMKVNALIVPHLTGETHSTIRPISKSAAMLALSPSGTFQFPGDRASCVQYYADIVRKLPCYEMLLGSNPAETTAVIKQFLEQFDG